LLDLLVLGAGPAGCAAAIQARRAGLDVLIVDAEERSRPAPGETLHPGIEAIFAALGIRDAVVAAGFHRHRGVWIEWDHPRRFEPYGEDASGPWLGFQADRQRLQAILLDAAVALGAQLKRPAAPDALIVEDAVVCGIVADGRELRARWTADATGRRGWVAAELALARTCCSPRLQARFGWRNDRIDTDGQPSIAADASGWNWQAPLGNGRTAWVLLTVHDPERHSSAPVGTDVSWRIHRACAGDGYFLLGDAAATLDPASSHGVLRALMSGMLCAHLVAASSRLLPADVIDGYTSWMQGQFEQDIRVLRTLYRRHPAAAVADLFAADAPVA
jgi:flavin-dependent dehydrogenase